MRIGALLLLSVFVVLGLRSLSGGQQKTRAEPPLVGPEMLGALQVCDGFDFPVGSPDSDGYYNAQIFGENKHLGEDWNGNGGGDSDLGDPVFSIADGIVLTAEDAGPGWGNVIRVVHNVGTSEEPQYVESLYAHLDSMVVAKGHLLRRGERLGTIGTANGKYLAHLHLELRDTLEMPIGAGYAADATGYLAPTAFINGHRARNP